MLRIQVRQLKNEFKSAELKARQRAGQISQQSAYRIRDDAKERVAVDTGETRDNINAVKLSEYTWEVQSTRPSTDGQFDVPVALEHGTIYMPAQPYLTPAAEADRQNFDGAVRKLFDGLV